MRLTLCFLVAAVAVDGEYIRRHRLVGPRPMPIEFHGLGGLDVEAFKPPARIPALDKLRSEIELVEKNEHDRIQRQLDAAKKAEDEFMNSDLHNAATHAKLFHIVE